MKVTSQFGVMATKYKKTKCLNLPQIQFVLWDVSAVWDIQKVSNYLVDVICAETAMQKINQSNADFASAFNDEKYFLFIKTCWAKKGILISFANFANKLNELN